MPARTSGAAEEMVVRSHWVKATRLDRNEPVWVNLSQVAALDWLVGQGRHNHTRITFGNGTFQTVLERPHVLLGDEFNEEVKTCAPAQAV
jgi:hypothetical protein